MRQETGAPALSIVLGDWPPEQADLKKAFLYLRDCALAQAGAVESLISRPGVSHSLRFDLAPRPQGRKRQVFFLVDVVIAGEFFLSVCFYEDEIQDHQELGNAIPQGLFEETGYCFDVDDDNCGDAEFMAYLRERIAEAHARASL